MSGWIERDRAVERAHVAPGLEDSAPRARASGRARRSRRDRGRGARASVDLARARSSKFEIGRRREDRIAAEDHEQLRPCRPCMSATSSASDAAPSAGEPATGACSAPSRRRCRAPRSSRARARARPPAGVAGHDDAIGRACAVRSAAIAGSHFVRALGRRGAVARRRRRRRRPRPAPAANAWTSRAFSASR